MTLKRLFEKAKANTPAIIMLDEIDAMFFAQGEGGENNETARRTLTELLILIEGWNRNILYKLRKNENIS